MNIEQKLGIKVFYYYLYKRISAGLVLCVISSIFSFLKTGIVSKITPLVSVDVAVVIVRYFSYGLFTISILVIAVGIFISWFDYISCTFMLKENSFNIKRGIFNKKEVSIPYRQIQSINIEQTFYFKTLGVSKLVILTAGNDSNNTNGESEGIFEIIDSSIAEKIREDLLHKTSVQTTKEIQN